MNPTRPSNGDVHALVGAYVLDAVDDLERVAFERHLASCPACATEVAELRSAAAGLSETVATPPPAGLRDRVLASAQATRQLPPATGEPPTAAHAVRRWQRRTILAAAAAVIAIAAAATTFTLQERRVQDERQQAAEVAAVLSAPDAAVTTADVEGGGRASVVFSESADEAVVVLSDLPEVSSEQAYQLWLVEGDEARSAGVLGGSVDARPVLVGDVGDAEVLAMTVEPRRGSREPTTTPLVALELA
jgi:anti-sigma-K factor RskA